MDDNLDLWTEDHINGGYGNILDEFAAEESADECPEFDEPWDELLAQQELEGLEQSDEFFGYFGDEGW